MTELASADISGLNALGHAIRLFKEMGPTISASTIETFCLIATREGRGISECARLAGVPFMNMSRQIADLGARNRYNGPGAGLIEKRAGRDERESTCYLTPKGRAFAKRISLAVTARAA
jgi:DNA-binding MarR family transcriptional regulator